MQCQSASHNFEEAIAYARRWLALDRLHEPAHQRLMLLYAWAGQRAAALHQYRECVQVLDSELSVAPLEATTQLYQRIKENRIPPLPVPLPEPASINEKETAKHDAPVMPLKAVNQPVEAQALTAGFPLVGRAEELALLHKTYATIDGGGRIILIEGEDGIGKTRLANELLSYARKIGAVVLEAACYEGESDLVYGPILSVLRAALSQ